MSDGGRIFYLVLGDRFEMHTAVSAAAPFGIPVAHIHGGESTEGAMDELFRHSITKMSHLHFVANREARRRVIQMGEEAWRVVVTGAPALDHLRAMHFLSKTDLAEILGIPLDPAPLLVTYHPVTLEWRRTSSQIRELLRALKRDPSDHFHLSQRRHGLGHDHPGDQSICGRTG